MVETDAALTPPWAHRRMRPPHLLHRLINRETRRFLARRKSHERLEESGDHTARLHDHVGFVSVRLGEGCEQRTVKLCRQGSKTVICSAFECRLSISHPGVRKVITSQKISPNRTGCMVAVRWCESITSSLMTPLNCSVITISN